VNLLAELVIGLVQNVHREVSTFVIVFMLHCFIVLAAVIAAITMLLGPVMA
jgi:hypothetical protein